MRSRTASSTQAEAGRLVGARRWPLLAVLMAVTTLAPFSIDIYTPSLPRIQSDLGGAAWVIQASITACLFGVGAGQLVFGPLSDRLGRRPVILGGIVGWTVLSALSAAVPSAWALVAARGLAGLLGSAGIVTARSVVRDVTADRHQLARRVGLLSMVSAAAPVVAPALGVAIAGPFGWRADFLALAGLGVVLAVAVVVLVPESLDPFARRPDGSIGRALVDAVRDRELRYLAIALAAQAFGFYAYVATASFIVEGELGYGAGVFALVFATNAGVMFGANLLFRRLARRLHPAALLGVGLSAALLGGALLAVAAFSAAPDWLLWVGSTVFAAAMGFILPGAHSWGQLTRPPSGASSALTGSAQFLGGVLGSPLTGALGPTASTLGIVIAASSALALAAWRLARRARARA